MLVILIEQKDCSGNLTIEVQTKNIELREFLNTKKLKYDNC